MGRLFLYLAVMLLAVAGIVMLVVDFISYVKSGKEESGKNGLRQFWLVHLCLILFLTTDLFMTDLSAGVMVFSFQSASLVSLGAARRWASCNCADGKVLFVLFWVFTFASVAWTLFVSMGHGRMPLPKIWEMYYLFVSVFAFSSYLKTSVREIDSFCKETCIVVYSRELVSLGMFIMDFMTVFAAMVFGGAVCCALSALFSLVLLVYMHLSVHKCDDLYLMPGLKSSVSEAISVSLLNGMLDVPETSEGDPARQYDITLRERFEEYFRHSKPFLNPDLSLNDAARALGTNKTYLSRMLNNGMGMNFSQAVNKYRIAYCVELFVKNPNMKLADMADAGGFRSLSTFSLAFRLNMGEAPGDWCRKMRSRIRKSSKKPVVIDG